MAGRCSEKGVADTPWAACLVAEEGDVCPHNFKKLEDDFACQPYGSRTPPYKKRVCCLLGPILDLQVRARLRLYYSFKLKAAETILRFSSP